MDHVTECPKCGSQLKISLSFASGPRKSQPSESVPIDDLGELLDMIDMPSLDAMSFEFVTKMKANFKKYKEKTLVSQKQLDWLRKLAEDKF